MRVFSACDGRLARGQTRSRSSPSHFLSHPLPRVPPLLRLFRYHSHSFLSFSLSLPRFTVSLRTRRDVLSVQEGRALSFADLHCRNFVAGTVTGRHGKTISPEVCDATRARRRRWRARLNIERGRRFSVFLSLSFSLSDVIKSPAFFP